MLDVGRCSRCASEPRPWLTRAPRGLLRAAGAPGATYTAGRPPGCSPLFAARRRAGRGWRRMRPRASPGEGDPRSCPDGAVVAATGHSWEAALGVLPGDFLGVRYLVDGVPVVHERLVLLLPSARPWTAALITPDGDEYDEDLLTATGGPCWGVLPRGAAGGSLGWLPGATYHRFGIVPTVAEMRAAVARAAARHGVAVPPEPVVPNIAGRFSSPPGGKVAALPCPAGPVVGGAVPGARGGCLSGVPGVAPHLADAPPPGPAAASATVTAGDDDDDVDDVRHTVTTLLLPGGFY